MSRENCDNYPTPSWCVERLLEAVRLPGGHWLEPASGDGAIVKVVDAYRSDVTWTTVDVRPEASPPSQSQNHLCADFVALGCPDLDALVPDGGQRRGWAWDVAITNPPYSSAEEYVRAALVETPIVVLLLRLGFLAGSQRSSWLRWHMPAEVWVLPDRPSFVGGRSDSSDYAWMVWRHPHVKTMGQVRILPSTSLCWRRRSGGES